MKNIMDQNSNFRINPNKIEAQNISITVPKNPSESITKLATSLGAIGIARNSVVFYNQYKDQTTNL